MAYTLAYVLCYGLWPDLYGMDGGRVLEQFAYQYFADNPYSFANADTVHILSFSIIMLNTDSHNVGVKKKMVHSINTCRFTCPYTCQMPCVDST